MNIKTLKSMAEHVILNQDHPSSLIQKFGHAVKDNGYGTFFLKPNDTMFSFFCVCIKGEKVSSIAFGGPDFELTLKDLCDEYGSFQERYERYDDRYEYQFVSTNATYKIQTDSKEKLFENNKMIKNVQIDNVEIIIQ